MVCYLLMLCSISEATPSAQLTVRVGWFQQPGYQSLTDYDWPVGYNYDFLQNIAKYTGWKYDFVRRDENGAPLTWRSAQRMLREGKLDLTGCMLYTPKRAKEYFLSTLPAGQTFNSLFVRDDSPLSASNYRDWKELSVAALCSTQNDEDLASFAAKTGFQVTFIDCATPQEVRNAVISGKADAGTMVSFQPDKGTRIIASFSPDPFYFAVSRKRPDLIAGLNSAMNAIFTADPFYPQTLALKYGQTYRGDSSFTPEERVLLAAGRKIRVAYSDIWNPLIMNTAGTGAAGGIAADILQKAARYSGLRLEFFYIPDQNEALSRTESGEFDMLACFPDDLPLAARSRLKLTSPYFSVQNVVLHCTTRALDGKVTGTLGPLSGSENSFSGPQKAQLVRFASPRAAFEALRLCRVDRIVINSAAASYFQTQTKYQNVASSVMAGPAISICAAISEKAPHSALLLSTLDKSLATLSHEDINQITITNMLYETSGLNAILSRLSKKALYALTIFFIAFVSLIITCLVAAVISSRRARKELERNNHILTTDSLTGLLNENGFALTARKTLDRPESRNWHIVDFDINSFEHINSVSGFEAGDQLLCRIAEIMRSRMIYPGEICARVHADHFICLCRAENTSLLAERVLEADAALRGISGESTVFISYGLYKIQDPALSVTSMCDKALDAKRSVKGNYENKIGIYNEELHRRRIEDSELVAQMETALAAGEFIPFYQPKYSALSGKIAGAEALVRWLHEGQRLMPDRFIPLFEKNGMIVKLDLFIFESVCKKLREQLDAGLPAKPVSVNFSRNHLYETNFTERVAAIVKRWQLPPSLLEIEFTESAFFGNELLLKEAIRKLHLLGLKVSVDDFGTGYSSLNTLKEMPFDIIKLDRGFISTVSTKKSRIVVGSILLLARSLGMITVAEGVETKEQYLFIKESGGDIIQGYYFSRPVSEEEYYRLLNEEGREEAK